jgi:polyhydroxybutyrate depolymerase
MMTHKIGIELSDRIAAICPVVATLFGDEKKPTNPVATIIFNGLLDKSVPYQGGIHDGLFANTWDPNVPPLRVIEQAHFWAKANGCKIAPQIVENAKFRHYLYKCPAGRNVEMYVIKDQGHAWPGGRPGTSESASPSQALSATDVMWEFFKSQSR